jgi:hypothetical protein
MHRNFVKIGKKNFYRLKKITNFLICQFLFMWDLKNVNLKWKKMWQNIFFFWLIFYFLVCEALIFKFIQKNWYFFEKLVFALNFRFLTTVGPPAPPTIKKNHNFVELNQIKNRYYSRVKLIIADLEKNLSHTLKINL